MNHCHIRIRRLTVTLPLAFCISCNGAQPVTRAPNTASVGTGRLVFLSAVQADQEIGKTTSIKDPKNGIDIKSQALTVLVGLDSNYDVGSACRLPVLPTSTSRDRLLFLAAPLAALAGWAIEKGVQWLAGKISSELQRQVDRYTRSYSIEGQTFDFYSNFTSLMSFDVSKAYRGCIRLTSIASTSGDRTADPLLSDLLIAVTHEPGQGSSVTLRPLRLFVARVQVPTSDNEVAISYSLTATSQARGLNSMGSDTDFSGPVLTAKVSTDLLNHQYFYKTYLGTEAGAEQHVFPIPSWDFTGIGNAPKNNAMKLTVTVTEIGSIPSLLKEVNELVQDNKDDVTKYAVSQLQSVANSAINPTAAPAKAASK